MKSLFLVYYKTLKYKIIILKMNSTYSSSSEMFFNETVQSGCSIGQFNETIQSEQLIYTSNFITINSVILISIGLIVLFLVTVFAVLEEDSLNARGSFLRRARRSGNANPVTYNNVVYLEDLNNNIIEV